jgi:hypothetical protein
MEGTEDVRIVPSKKNPAHRYWLRGMVCCNTVENRQGVAPCLHSGRTYFNSISLRISLNDFPFAPFAAICRK